jgi:hypothetical protein
LEARQKIEFERIKNFLLSPSPSLLLLLFVDKESQFTSPNLSCVERAGTSPPSSFFITLLFKQPKKFENPKKIPTQPGSLSISLRVLLPHT